MENVENNELNKVLVVSSTTNGETEIIELEHRVRAALERVEAIKEQYNNITGRNRARRVFLKTWRLLEYERIYCTMLSDKQIAELSGADEYEMHLARGMHTKLCYSVSDGIMGRNDLINQYQIDCETAEEMCNSFRRKPF